MSDVFMSTLGPLVSLCEVAQEGHTQLLQDSVILFERHANSMLNVSQADSCHSDIGSVYVVSLYRQLSYLVLSLTMQRAIKQHTMQQKMSKF